MIAAIQATRSTPIALKVALVVVSGLVTRPRRRSLAVSHACGLPSHPMTSSSHRCAHRPEQRRCGSGRPAQPARYPCPPVWASPGPRPSPLAPACCTSSVTLDNHVAPHRSLCSLRAALAASTGTCSSNETGSGGVDSACVAWAGELSGVWSTDTAASPSSFTKVVSTVRRDMRCDACSSTVGHGVVSGLGEHRHGHTGHCLGRLLVSKLRQRVLREFRAAMLGGHHTSSCSICSQFCSYSDTHSLRRSAHT